MASANAKKYTLSGASAVFRHNFRENLTNSNEHIDPSKSHLNVNLDTRYSSSKEVSSAIRNRVKEIDKVLPPKRKKKDRIGNISIEIPSPRANMSYEDSVRFLKAAYEELVKKYGLENCHGAWIHADEIHEYLNPVTKKMEISRIHLHMDVVPFVDGVGVNGKKFCNRTFLRELNKTMNMVCQREFGYDFNDGTKIKSKAKVEDLKAESLKAAMEKNQELTLKNEELQSKNDELESHISDLEQDYRNKSHTYREISKEVNSLKEEKTQLQEDISEGRQLKELCDSMKKQPTKTYKTNLSGKMYLVPVEDMDQIQQVQKMAAVSLENLQQAKLQHKAAEIRLQQANEKMNDAKALESAHLGYDKKLSELDSHIEKEATRIAKKEVYEVLGNRVDQDQRLTAFFKEKGLWGSFQQFCNTLAKQIVPTKPRVRDRDDGWDR